MAKNDLGFEQDEFQSMSDNPFERADQGAQEPGTELGALEVSPTRQPRSFQNMQALEQMQQQEFAQNNQDAELEQLQASEQEQSQILEMELLEEQMQLQELQQQDAEDQAELSDQQKREQNTQKIFLWGTITILLFPPVGITLLKYPILVEDAEKNGATMITANIQKLLGKYAPYPVGKRFMAEFMIWFVPAVWSVVATGFLIVLLVYVSIMSICSFDSAAAQATLGSACEYYFGISSSQLQ